MFTEDDMLLVSVETQDQTLTDSLSAYRSRSGFYLPFGELARLLDLAVMVDPPRRRAEGWVLERGRAVSLDLDGLTATADGRAFVVQPVQAVLVGDEIYVRADLLQKLLPLDLKVDLASLVVKVIPREPLPFQTRLALERRRAGIGPRDGTARASVVRVATPYQAFTAPAFDVSLAAGAALRQPAVTSFEVRAGGDLAWAGMQAFVGSDDRGRVSDARLTLGRTDPEGRLGGPLHLTMVEAGDVFTPTMSLGARSAGGRGVALSSAPTDQANVFNRYELRGELPVGWQVELYVNEILSGSQATPVQGRYEFTDVPLSFGMNTLRLVFYGPHGERREEVRRMNFGAAQVPQGRTVVNFGAAQVGENLFDVHPVGAVAAPGDGKWRLVGSVEHGLTPRLTLAASVSQYDPGVVAGGDLRRVATAGFRTSAAGFAFQADVGHDFEGGSAVSLEAAGRPFGATLVARDVEYDGEFYDEVAPEGVVGPAPLRRSSELQLTALASFLRGELQAPLSADVRWGQWADGTGLLKADARTSFSVSSFLISPHLSYSGLFGPSDASTTLGGVDASRLYGAWQVRGDVEFTMAPRAGVDSVALAIEHRRAQAATRLALAQSFGAAPDTTVQFVQSWRMARADVSFTAAYSSQLDDFQIGVQLAFGLMFDPSLRRYTLRRPGVAAGGELMVDAFVDRNGDGVRQADEPGVGGLAVSAGGRTETSNVRGDATLTGVGEGAYVRAAVDAEKLDDPYAVLPGEAVEFLPRPGRLTRASYPLKTVGEVQVRMSMRRPDAQPRGVSALSVQLVSSSGQVVSEGRTEYDGGVFLEKVPPGDFELRLEPAQAERLKLYLVNPVKVHVPPQGGYAGSVEGAVSVR